MFKASVMMNWALGLGFIRENAYLIRLFLYAHQVFVVMSVSYIN